MFSCLFAPTARWLCYRVEERLMREFKAIHTPATSSTAAATGTITNTAAAAAPTQTVPEFKSSIRARPKPPVVDDAPRVLGL
jgi:hypothetical protein